MRYLITLFTVDWLKRSRARTWQHTHKSFPTPSFLDCLLDGIHYTAEVLAMTFDKQRPFRASIVNKMGIPHARMGINVNKMGIPHARIMPVWASGV